MGKPQLTQLPNYPNYQNPTKWKPHILSWLHSTFPEKKTFLAPLYFPRKKNKNKEKTFLNLKFLFLSPPLPPDIHSDQKTLTSALSVWFLIEVWFEIFGNFFFLRDLLWLTRRSMVKITWTNMTARNTKTPHCCRCRCRWRTRFRCAVLDPERDWVDGAFDGYSHLRRGQRSVASAERSRWPRSSMICARSRQTAIRRHNWWRWDFWVSIYIYIYIYFYWCFWFFFAWVFWCLIFFLCNFFFSDLKIS